MVKDTVFKRDISDEIQKYLNTDNIIVLHGARQVGKTHILYYLQNFLTAKTRYTSICSVAISNRVRKY